MRIEELTLCRLGQNKPLIQALPTQGRLAGWVKDEERWKPTRISGILSGTLPEYPPGGKLIVLTNEEKAGVINSP